MDFILLRKLIFLWEKEIKDQSVERSISELQEFLALSARNQPLLQLHRQRLKRQRLKKLLKRPLKKLNKLGAVSQMETALFF